MLQIMNFFSALLSTVFVKQTKCALSDNVCPTIDESINLLARRRELEDSETVDQRQ